MKVMLLLLAAGAVIGARSEANATRAGWIALAAGLSATTLYYLGYV